MNGSTDERDGSPGRSVPVTTESPMDSDLYLNPTTPTMTQAGPDGETTWVPADHFMQVQKERDDWRRLASLLHALHYHPDLFTQAGFEDQAKRLGLTRLDADAMAGLVREARTWANDAFESETAKGRVSDANT